MRVFSTALISAFFIMNANAASAARTAECEAALSAARDHKGDAAALEQDFAIADRSCEADDAASVSNALAFALFNQAQKASGAERRALLTRAGTHTKDWRVHATLGAELLEAGDRAAAAVALQNALVDLQENDGKNAPPETVRKIITMANNARALAGPYTRAVRTRSGAPGGVAADRISGVEIESVPFPIEFEFAEATPTEDGAFAISDLADILSGADASRLTLAGHTDPVGGDGANRALSQRRAEAVRDALIIAGVRGADRMQVIGCGEASPPLIESPEYYSEPEIHQIMRRVELVRGGAACP